MMGRSRDTASRSRVRTRPGGCPRSALLLVTLLVGLASPDAARSSELVVGVASSLRVPIAVVAQRFERSHPGVRLRLSYGASSALAAQLRLGAPLDVLLSADREIIQSLRARALLDEANIVDFARGRLVVITRNREARAFRIEQLASMSRVAIPSAVVPLGRYARAFLRRHALLERMAGRFVITEHARATIAAVEGGHAEAAIVYRTDALASNDVDVVFEVADDDHPPIVYTAGLARRSAAREAGSRFIAELVRVDGRSALESAGFDVPTEHD